MQAQLKSWPVLHHLLNTENTSRVIVIVEITRKAPKKNVSSNLQYLPKEHPKLV